MLYHCTEAASGNLRRPVVAIGNFDGVHRGHRAVVERAVAKAGGERDATILTFEPHPRLFFRPDTPEFRLTDLTHKAELLTACGADAVVAAQFDAALAALEPRQFVDDILCRQLGATAVLVGANFRYGARRVGDVDSLRVQADGRFEVFVVEPIRDEGGEVISSTRVRAALAAAQMDAVTTLLGRPFEVRGEVRHGDGLGKGFGFPTANVAPTTPTLPPDGIYATNVESGGLRYAAATYVGTRPTVGGTERVVEAFCLDAPTELDLYGDAASVAFIAQVRGDEDFPSTEAMIEQMHRDVAAVREILAG